MSTSSLWILLFVPFFIVGLPIVICYMIKGYRAGLKHSVMSVLGTVIAVIVSVVLAKLTTLALSGVIVSLVHESLFAEAGVLSGLVASLVQGIVGIVVAFVFFLIYFIVAVCVAKKLIQKIKFEKCRDDPEKKHSKWLGLTIRAIDSIVVSSLCLIPVYGLLAYTVPVASSAYTAMEGESEDDPYLPFFRCIENHPMVVLSRVGPTSMVIGALTDLDIGDASINLADMSEDIQDLLTQYIALTEASDEDRLDAFEKFNTTLRRVIVEEPWFYDFMRALVDETQNYVADLPDSGDRETVQRILAVFDITEEEFRDNAVTLIDFVTYSIDCGMVERMRWDNYEYLPDEYYVELGKLINYSDQAVALKKEIVLDALTTLYYQDSDDYYTSYETAREEAARKAQALMDAHWDDGYVSPDRQKREAYSFICFTLKHDKADLIEGVARHPKFGADVAMQFVDGGFVMSFYDRWLEPSEGEAMYEKSQTIKDAVAKIVKERENAPMDDLELKKYFELVANTVVIVNADESGSYYYSVPDDEKAWSLLVDTIGEEYFATTNPTFGRELYTVISAQRNVPPEEGVYSVSVDFGSFIELVITAKNPRNWPDKVPDKNSRDSYYSDLYSTASRLVSASRLCKGLKAVIEEKGSDPFGLGEKLTPAQKAVFEECIESAIENETIGYNRYYGVQVTLDADGNYVMSDGGSVTLDDSELKEYEARLRENAKVIRQLIGIG